MANSKNTIQNIPLEGALCLNALKTDVKQFQGYNEKNTTVYGGTLSPIYDKTTELFDKDTSYTVFNSKGEACTLYKESGVCYLTYPHQGSTISRSLTNCYTSKTEKLDVPNNTIVAAKLHSGSVITVNKNEGVYIDGQYLDSFTFGHNLLSEYEAQIGGDFQDGGVIIGLMDNQSCQAMLIKPNHTVIKSTIYSGSGFRLDKGDVPIIVASYNSTDGGRVAFMKDSGKINDVVSLYIDITDGTSFNNWDLGSTFYYQTGNNIASQTMETSTASYTAKNEVQQFCGRSRNESGYLKWFPSNTNQPYGGGYTGHDGNGYIPCPIGSYGNWEFSEDFFSIYYQDGALISIGHLGLLIDTVLGYGRNLIYYHFTGDGESMTASTTITYKKDDGTWWCYTSMPLSSVSDSEIKEHFSRMILDNRYIILRAVYGLDILDTETWLYRPENAFDWIAHIPPRDYSAPTTTTGCVFGAGINAGYAINGSPFVGYLPNPFVMTDFPDVDYVYYDSFDSVGYFHKMNAVQAYFSKGDNVQSAKYYGNDPLYFDTIYASDSNGNVLLPVANNAQIIHGYSNNDLVKEGNTVYPLMYYNNNQKTYSYFLISSMENVTDVFSLQGQSYSVDDNNIYAMNFNNGVISNVTPVAYKKNLTFLGTLPTQAVFWSAFNKTFYAFTGDRILSKMFEASDINKIHYVGQNPATLSLWICTDNGIYILSDTDMFKLPFTPTSVSFYDKNALFLADNGEKNVSHVISLYLNDNEQGEMIPVKLQTAYYGLGSEQKAVMDCWYLRLFDEKKTEGYVKVRVNTITDVTRHTEEKTYKFSPSDYDDNNIIYIRYQPKYQECVAMQLELETNLGIYSMALGVNTTDSTAQVSKFNF